jgi:hypothetical protein
MNYPINEAPCNPPVDGDPASLLARRQFLVAAVLDKVPLEAREEFKRLLSRDAVDVIFSIEIEELADPISEIYYIDRLLPPD